MKKECIYIFAVSNISGVTFHSLPYWTPFLALSRGRISLTSLKTPADMWSWVDTILKILSGKNIFKNNMKISRKNLHIISPAVVHCLALRFGWSPLGGLLCLLFVCVQQLNKIYFLKNLNTSLLYWETGLYLGNILIVFITLHLLHTAHCNSFCFAHADTQIKKVLTSKLSQQF